jgi:flavin-dependent dehydrogenase
MIHQLPAGASRGFDHWGSAPEPHRDVIVVGGRAAGAATAMLLARTGANVLVVDRSMYGSDTLSSHALMRGAVDQLERWELLDRIAATTPPIRNIALEFGGDHVSIPTGNVPLYAPRRTVLDPVLVDAACDAGAEFRFQTRVTGVLRNASGRVRGVATEDAEGRRSDLTADVVVGADGLRSFVARQVDAPVTRLGRHSLASLYTYVRGAELDADDFRFAYGDRLIGGSIPTNDGLHLVFVSMAPQAFRSGVHLDVQAALIRSLDRVSPTIAAGAREGVITGPIRSFPGHTGRLLRPHGPGWVLVGDAGYFKDPVAAHGLSDALRDAELAATAILTGNLDEYEHVRDTLSMPLFDHIDHLASLEWTPQEAAGLLVDLGTAMAEESDAFLRHLAAVPGSARQR